MKMPTAATTHEADQLYCGAGDRCWRCTCTAHEKAECIGQLFRAHARALCATRTCFLCEGVSQQISVWAFEILFIPYTDNEYELFIKTKIPPKKDIVYWLIFLALPYDWSSGCFEIFSF